MLLASASPGSEGVEASRGRGSARLNDSAVGRCTPLPPMSDSVVRSVVDSRIVALGVGSPGFGALGIGGRVLADAASRSQGSGTKLRLSCVDASCFLHRNRVSPLVANELGEKLRRSLLRRSTVVHVLSQ